MNPILNSNVYIPDVEAHTMPDGRLYIYGSHDIAGDTEFCSTNYVVYSTDDMIHWKNHGVIFNSTEDKYEFNTGLTLGAPDCLYKDGKYYLYYCTYGNGMGVAVSNYPYGPFIQLGMVHPADGDSIDPAAFLDDDGKVYYFWGQFNLKGGVLNDDMRTVDRKTIKQNILSEHEHGFHEGASIRKINGKYYLLYIDISRGKATSLAYAVADNPLGPYTKGGIVIDNVGCDPKTWNNHGSIECFNEQYYVFYHRSSENSIYSRRACVEKIEILNDGSIPEVKMSSNGVLDAIDCEKELSINILSKMKTKLPFNNYEAMHLECMSGEDVLIDTKENDWVQIDGIEFNESIKGIEVEASTLKPTEIEIYISNNQKIGECVIDSTKSWNNFKRFSAPIQKVNGIQTIWFKFKGLKNSVGRLANVKSFKFLRR